MEHICNIQEPNVNFQSFKTLVYTRERGNFLSFFSSGYVKVCQQVPLKNLNNLQNSISKY